MSNKDYKKTRTNIDLVSLTSVGTAMAKSGGFDSDKAKQSQGGAQERKMMQEKQKDHKAEERAKQKEIEKGKGQKAESKEEPKKKKGKG